MSLPPLFRRPSEKIIGARRSALDVARGRLVFVGICFSLGYILLAARTMDLTVIQGELPRLAQVGSEEGDAPEQAVAEAKPLRGDITDRNGVLLARSLNTASLYADTYYITQPEKVAAALVKIMPDLKYADVLQKLQKKTHFIWLRRNLTPKNQIAILNMGQPGLNFQDEAHRIYPQGAIASHIVGFTDIDGRGLGGVERNFNALLETGTQPLKLTIDIRLQHIMRRELNKAIREFSGVGGVGAIMDVNTGEVLAAVSEPDFDPQSVGEEDRPALFSRLTQGVYEMGSTFKIFTAAAMIELKNPGMGQTFDARAPIEIGGFKIKDYHPENAWITIPEIFMVSSNIGAARMAEQIGTTGLRQFFKDVGLLDPLQIEIQEVGRPLVPNPWRPISTLTASYGHGIAVTPLQTLGAVSSVINGGTLVHPTLVMDSDLSKKDKSGKHVVSAETSHRMRQLLRLVVTNGTGKSADVPGFQVGGKTGTAEKNSGGNYNHKSLLSSFIGVYPMNAPKYAVLVMVDEPKGTKASHGYATGGWVGAPPVGRIVAAMAPVLGIVPKDIPHEQDMATPLLPYIKNGQPGEKHLASVGVE
ncbi:MAG: Cell division protein FtsI [Micavibrio sp.]|nr:Cell division protein FtsI [Micavibrio sp.]